MKQIIGILLSILILSFCNNYREQRSTGQYFEFYNLYSLKGINPITIEHPDYPYVMINNIGDSIVINHFISSTETYKSVYVKHKNYFKRVLFDKEERDMSKTEEYIRGNIIYTLNYDMSGEGSRLGTVGTFKNDSLVTFELEQVIKGEFTIDSALSLIKGLKKGSIETTVFKRNSDSILVLTESKKVMDSVSRYQRKYKFYSNGKPLEWWILYKWQLYLKSINMTSKNLMYLGIPENEL